MKAPTHRGVRGEDTVRTCLADLDAEKLARSFMALNHLAAAIIAFRKITLTVHIICGWCPSRC